MSPSSANLHGHNSLLTIFADKRTVYGVDGKHDAYRRRRRSGRFLLPSKSLLIVGVEEFPAPPLRSACSSELLVPPL